MKKPASSLADRFHPAYIVGLQEIPSTYGDRRCEKCRKSLHRHQIWSIPSLSAGAVNHRWRRRLHLLVSLPLDVASQQEWLSTKAGFDSHEGDWKNKCIPDECQVVVWVRVFNRANAVTRDLGWEYLFRFAETKREKCCMFWFGHTDRIHLCNLKALFESKGGRRRMEKILARMKCATVAFRPAKNNIVFHCIICPAMLKAHEVILYYRRVCRSNELPESGREIKLPPQETGQSGCTGSLTEFPGKQGSIALCALVQRPRRTKINGGLRGKISRAKETTTELTPSPNFAWNRTLVAYTEIL